MKIMSCEILSNIHQAMSNIWIKNTQPYFEINGEFLFSKLWNGETWNILHRFKC